MNKLQQKFEAGSVWFNERPVRERVLILLTACVLVLVIGWELLVAPVLAERQQLENRIQTLSSTRDNLISEQETLNNQLADDPSAKMRKRLQGRKDRLARLDQRISDTASQLIAPRDMVALLRSMLAAQQDLALESVVLLTPEPVYEGPPPASEDTEAGNAPEPLLYAHDVELTVSGNYLAVLQYLEKLEAMDDRLGWLQLTYDAGEWPGGEARLRVRTLSLEAAWLGV